MGFEPTTPTLARLCSTSGPARPRIPIERVRLAVVGNSAGWLPQGYPGKPPIKALKLPSRAHGQKTLSNHVNFA